MSKDLIEMTQGGAVIEITPEDRALMGIDGMEREDIMVPRLRLVQGQSVFPGNPDPGTIHNSVTGSAVKEFEAVVLRVSRGQIMWPEKFKREDDPLCASDDGLMPRAEYGSLYDHGQGCHACPMQDWGDNGEPPRCARAYNYLVYNIDTDMPGAICMSRTSVKTAKQLNALIMAYNVKHAIRFFVSDIVVGTEGKWYEWRVADAGPVDNPAKYLQAARSLAGSKLTTDTEHAENGNGKSADTDFDVSNF